MTQKSRTPSSTSFAGNKTKKEIGFTRVANSVCRDPHLSPYDKAVYLAINSCDPSFPSYEKIMEWTGMSRERLWKSLRNLEKLEMISRLKQGKKIVYRTFWTSSPHELMEGQRVRFTNPTSSPHELKPVRQANPKKTKETDQLNREENKIKNPLLNEAIENRDLKTVIEITLGGLNKSGSDDFPF